MPDRAAVSAGEYSVIMAEADNTVHQFCMVYFSEFKELPESPERMPFVQMVNLTSQDGCKKLQSINLHGKVALIKDSGNCTLDKVVLHYKAAQAYGIVISTQKSRVDNIIINRNDTRHLDLVVGFVTDVTGNSLLSLMKPKEPLLTKLFTKKSLAFDYSLIIIWLVAVFTLGVGSYWSGLVKHEIYQHEIGKCSHASHAGAEGEESSFPKSENVLEEESSLDVSPILVTLFVICMGVMLLLLYFFFQYLVFFIIGMFALASVVSVIGVLEPLIYKIPIGTTRIPRNVCPCFHGPLEVRQLALIVFAISVSVTWVVLRHHPQSWILQDLLGVAFSINMLKTLRLPNLMICSVLLVLLFFYDIFFVFVTPFLTMKGESIMVEVAKGGNTQEQLPMVLRVPHFNNESLSVCFGQFSLLGFGDILVPGLLVAYCHGFDLLTTRSRLYFFTGTLSRPVGTDGADRSSSHSRAAKAGQQCRRFTSPIKSHQLTRTDQLEPTRHPTTTCESTASSKQHGVTAGSLSVHSAKDISATKSQFWGYNLSSSHAKSSSVHPRFWHTAAGQHSSVECHSIS
ncbi:hypothetical protein HPB50_003807 [Hyalomma asiaticum]|uniref:Uncharacterized protein n=1 Tax=Hyalomma asiaticum TaxID=266040 RepID=A0ACB7S6J1_HYAAI|nr:hypothetical protein HPB50_003807 [Hyalomma asiaticum]